MKLKSKDMAAGDPQRVWFSEMIHTLRAKWRRGLSVEEMIGLRVELDGMLQEIRRERQIRSPPIRCSDCGYVGEGAPPQVSVRAMILAVKRFEIDDADTTRAAEKAWIAFQSANHLDLYGKPVGSGDRAKTTKAHSH